VGYALGVAPERAPNVVERYFAAENSLLRRVRPTWWGAVVTDERFPDIYDLNYARVDAALSDLALDDVLSDLIPAVVEAGSRHIQIGVLQPEGTARLLEEARRAGLRVSWDTVMELREPADGAPAIAGGSAEDVEEADTRTAEFWGAHGRGLRAFEVTAPEVVEQLQRWAREILIPAGRRYFAVRRDGEIAGHGALQVRAGIAYIDDVVTFHPHRRQGIASAVVRRMVREARRSGAEATFLLADQEDPIRLYRSLGFSETGRVASALGPLPPDRAGSQPTGRPAARSGSG